MNNANIATGTEELPGFDSEREERLQSLDRIYRSLGLSPRQAAEAALADLTSLVAPKSVAEGRSGKGRLPSP